jgi:hypothetical protein
MSVNAQATTVEALRKHLPGEFRTEAMHDAAGVTVLVYAASPSGDLGLQIRVPDANFPDGLTDANAQTCVRCVVDSFARAREGREMSPSELEAARRMLG